MNFVACLNVWFISSFGILECFCRDLGVKSLGNQLVLFSNSVAFPARGFWEYFSFEAFYLGNVLLLSFLELMSFNVK